MAYDELKYTGRFQPASIWVGLGLLMNTSYFTQYYADGVAEVS